MTRNHRSHPALPLAIALVCASLAWAPLHADEIEPGITDGSRFTQQDGAALYLAICQGCHMADGKGASGAGSYPALAGNARLASTAYPAILVLKGRKAMPAFGGELSDAQVAAVSNYVRSHLGNTFPGALTAADVKALR
jgi:mono/diheme cytochrome c family protein